MEYKNQENYEQAVETFVQLLNHDSGYLPAYFHYGMSLRRMGDDETAAQVFSKGIEVAEQKGDWHARDELQAALEELREQL